MEANLALVVRGQRDVTAALSCSTIVDMVKVDDMSVDWLVKAHDERVTWVNGNAHVVARIFFATSILNKTASTTFRNLC